MSTIIDRVRREPALVAGLVQAVLAVVTRQQVTPHVDVLEHAVDGEVVAGPANERVAEGHVVREIVEPLDGNLRA